MSENKTIILKATDFQYPSKEELRIVNLFKPKFKLFSFSLINPFGILENGAILSNKELKRTEDLYHWNYCLQNKIHSLVNAYSIAIVNFNRGVPDDFKSFNDEIYINRIQFDFYCETYFYFFVSVQDTLWQILNIYYNIGLDEYKVFYDKFIYKVTDQKVKDRVAQFRLTTKDISNFRNKFTHRFLLTFPDYRPSIKEENGNQILSSGIGNFTKSSKLAEQIKISLKHIAAFITDISLMMP
ncbi:MAG: hypothetical protein EOP42_14550 [Sphingobacteriaceae bacterium]|nr:MAG: hypothetical protein EOP42_14550 [Sphingobacteriaceae bacterium]